MPDDVHFTVQLPAKRMAADCLFFDEDDRLLVVEPTYTSTWTIPGGVVERDESPRLAARREVGEELGLNREPGRLLAVDWQAQRGPFTETIAFLFDGGVLRPIEIDTIVLARDEIRSFRFVGFGAAARLLDDELFDRVTAGIEARVSGAAAYLEDGHRPTPA